MAVEEVLNPEAVTGVAIDACPKCGAEWGEIPAVEPNLLARRPVRRCNCCGTRFAIEDQTPKEVLTCEVSGLPFLADELLPGENAVSPRCRSGATPSAFSDPMIVHACEHEIRKALESSWKFVAEPKLTDYLNRIARQLAEQLPQAPQNVRIVLFDDEHLRTLALPSGLILLSVAWLAFLEDESELAFTLAHELAHAANGDAGARIVWLSLEAIAKQSAETPAGPSQWRSSAHDVIRLGHGRKRELEADRTAMEACLALNYEPASVLRMLNRLEGLLSQGQAERCQELAASHPPSAERRRALEHMLQDWVHTDAAPKVNRAVYRQAAGHSVLSEQLVPFSGLADPALDDARRRERRAALLRKIGIACGIVALAALFLWVGSSLR